MMNLAETFKLKYKVERCVYWRSKIVDTWSLNMYNKWRIQAIASIRVFESYLGLEPRPAELLKPRRNL